MMYLFKATIKHKTLDTIEPAELITIANNYRSAFSKFNKQIDDENLIVTKIELIGINVAVDACGKEVFKLIK